LDAVESVLVDRPASLGSQNESIMPCETLAPGPVGPKERAAGQDPCKSCERSAMEPEADRVELFHRQARRDWPGRFPASAAGDGGD